MTATVTSPNTSKRIITFLGITFGLAAIAYVLLITTTDGFSGDSPLGALVQFAPTIGALSTLIIYQRNLRGIGWGWGRGRYYLLSYITPVLVLLLSYGLLWLTLGGFYDEAVVAKLQTTVSQDMDTTFSSSTHFLLVWFILNGTANMLFASIFAIGEEIGWRGFLVSELAPQMSFSKIALTTGLIWALYHYPLILFLGEATEGVSLVYQLLMATIASVAISTILAWFRLKSDSFWPIVIFHGSLNAFLQNFFEPVTADTPLVAYLTGDYGAIQAIGFGIVAYLFWRKRNSLDLAKT